MILGNRGYNAYDVNKKNERDSVRMEESNGMDQLSRFGIANGIDEVSLVPIFLKLISLAQYQKTNDTNEIYQFWRLPSSNRFRKGKILINYSKRIR